MKNILILTPLTFTINIFSNPCFSSNSDVSDSAYWSSTAITLLTEKRYEEAVAVVDLCMKFWSSDAVAKQNEMIKNKTPSPKVGAVTYFEKAAIQKNYLINDVSMALWTKARALHELNLVAPAKIAYAKCINMSHGRAWDPNGWFWSPSEDCANRAKKLLRHNLAE